MLRVLYVICFLLCGFSSYAGIDTSSYYHFNLKNGLPTNYVYSIIRDKDGYTWFATDNGLVKYNGYTFEVYNTDNGGLSANDVIELYEDNRGRIWTRTFGYDFGYLENGKYRKVYSTPGKNITAQFLCSYGGLVYFTDMRASLYTLLIVDDNLLKAYPFDLNMFREHGIDTVMDVTPLSNLEFIIWSADNRLFQFGLSTNNKLKYLGRYPDYFREIYVNRMSVMPTGEIYMFKLGADGIFFIDVKTLETKKRSLSDWGADRTEKNVCLSPRYIRHNFIEHSALITNTHTYTYTDNLELVSRQKNSDIIPSNQQLLSRMKDIKGTFWYGTMGDGVWARPSGYDFFSQRKKNDILDKSRYLGSVGNISMWWDNVKAELYEVKGEQIINRLKFNKGIEVKDVSGNDTAVYLASSDGIYKYSRKTGKLANTYERYYDQKEIPGFDYGNNRTTNFKLILHSFRKVQAIGDVLYCLNYSGLHRISTNDGILRAKRFGEDRFTDFFFDENKRTLYAYSSRKIMLLNIDNDEYKNVDIDELKRMKIRNTKSLKKDMFGNIWLLDDNSLFLCDDQLHSARKIETKMSLIDCIFNVVGDKLFIAGKFGIGYATIKGYGEIGDFLIVPNGGTHHYSRIEDFVINNDSYGMLNNDEEWFSFALDSLVKYAMPIDEHNSFFSLTTVGPFKKLIHSNDTIKVGQSESILKLDAINYSGKGVVKYTYRISGLETDKWETSTSGEVFLANLSADKYHKIECRVKDDLWESGTCTFYIYRYPKWYQTSSWKTIFWISGVLLFACFVLITIFITRFFVARKNERKRALTELELKAIHSQINPHFIFNTLSAALFYINKKRFDDAYTHVNKFSQLLRSYLKSSQDRYVMLDEEIKMLRNYIELQQIRFEEKFQYQIEIDNKLPTNNVRIPSLLLQPLVENAINHGLFHKEKGGILLLKFEQGNDSTELVCTIEDNGVGRAESKKINDANSTKDSYGTKLTNQLLEVFKLYENLDIKLKYFDKELPETGTIVILTLKNVNYVA